MTTKLLFTIALVFFLAFGSSQLRIEAAGSCPPDSCGDLQCIIFGEPVGYCNQGGRQVPIYETAGPCPVSTCYGGFAGFPARPLE